MHGQVSQKTLWHKQHPPSKVFNLDSTHSVKIKQENHEEINKFKLNRVYDDKFVAKRSFITCNSTGPLSREHRVRKPNAMKTRGVIVIQRWFRGILQRQLFRKYKKDKSIFAGMLDERRGPPSAAVIFGHKYKPSSRPVKKV